MMDSAIGHLIKCDHPCSFPQCAGAPINFSSREQEVHMYMRMYVRTYTDSTPLP
jgi:hypothetical protein